MLREGIQKNSLEIEKYSCAGTVLKSKILRNLQWGTEDDSSQYV